jgi:hypothetical protein
MSNRVDDWFWTRFIPLLLARLPRADWPLDDSEFWEGMRQVFVKHGITEPVAADACLAMMESPAPFPDQFVAAFLATVKLVWARSEVTPGGLNDRDSAVQAMRAQFNGSDCNDCQGQGFATRYRRKSLGALDVKERPVAPHVTFYCRCPVGRWVERRHREGSDDSRAVRKRIPDLDDYPELWGDEFRGPPVDDDDEATPTTFDALKAKLARHLAESAARVKASPTRRPGSWPTVVMTEPNPETVAAAEVVKATQLAALADRLPKAGERSEIAEDLVETKE